SLFTLVGHMMLARPGEWNLLIAAGGVTLATVVLLVDSYVIVRSSWHLQGITELKRCGLAITGTAAARIKNGAFVIVRLGLSLVLAQLVAIFLSILLFEKDISGDLQRQHHHANHAIVARASSQVDGNLAKLQGEHKDILARLRQLADEEASLRKTSIDPASD